uniref:Uncharacterized protein n=1 Tax=Arundo donax TaxID=35708 RepID=A0A0A9BHU5_ARUDO
MLLSSMSGSSFSFCLIMHTSFVMRLHQLS